MRNSRGTRKANKQTNKQINSHWNELFVKNGRIYLFDFWSQFFRSNWLIDIGANSTINSKTKLRWPRSSMRTTNAENIYARKTISRTIDSIVSYFHSSTENRKTTTPRRSLKWHTHLELMKRKNRTEKKKTIRRNRWHSHKCPMECGELLFPTGRIAFEYFTFENLRIAFARGKNRFFAPNSYCAESHIAIYYVYVADAMKQRKSNRIANGDDSNAHHSWLWFAWIGVRQKG